MNIYNSLTNDERGFLDAWEEIYKRGHLTFWVLLALSDRPLRVVEIHSTINTFSANNFYVGEQSLYRALRRFHSVGLVEVTRESDRRNKLYTLTKTGKNILKGFVERNIAPFYSLSLQTTIKELVA